MEKQRADLLLVELGHCESRARAQAAIAAGLVTADGVVVRKASQEISTTAKIHAEAPHPYVSRGGLKLAQALTHFEINPASKTCLDVGASTGGFSDVLLRGGARRIYAVDTGHSQFHKSLQENPQIILLESFDARNLTLEHVPEPVELTVIDVSFISLTLVMPAALALSGAGAQMVALIKPQFEVGKANIAKGGIVKDETLYAPVNDRISLKLEELGWQVQGIIPCSTMGGDGNREFLIAAQRVT